MKKVKIPKKAQNELLKLMAANQNSKKKMNAGSLREVQALLVVSLPMLSAESLLAFQKVIESLLESKI